MKYSFAEYYKDASNKNIILFKLNYNFISRSKYSDS